MKGRFSSIAALAGGLLIAVALAWVAFSGWERIRHDWPGRETAGLARNTSVPPSPGPDDTLGETAKVAQLKARLRQRLERADARRHEAVLTFNTDEAYRRFLARAASSGLSLRGRLDALRRVRVGYESLDPLFNDLAENAADYAGADPNYLVHVPQAPAPEDRPKVTQVPLGNTTMAFLGVAGDHSQWGNGVTVAVLDTGVAADPTFGQGRLNYLDIGLGVAPGAGAEDGHGTAVAGLVAGAAPDAPGVAAAAGILSIRVTGNDGTSDSFALAQGIVAAVDAGARIVNISLGAYYETAVLDSAIDYAAARGAVLVASAGNDGAAQLTWPAADPRVISVGAVDALEQQVYFSNSGAQLKIMAPGYGVDTAWLDGARVTFDGTSASAPLVAGAVAALMSTNPGMNAAQAWSVLQQYASDGGPPGPDTEYGGGILNLGWAMGRNDPSRVDTAIAGQYFDAASGTMNIVVQNRGGQAVSGLELKVEVSGAGTLVAIPALAPGATYLVATPVDAARVAATGGIVFRAQLSNPPGLVDQEPANNAKGGVIVPPFK